jgi:hypothetical protein
MEQLGVAVPVSRWDAARFWPGEIVIAGTLTPYEGARLIWWHGWEELGYPDQLTPSSVRPANAKTPRITGPSQAGHLRQGARQLAGQTKKRDPNRGARSYISH